MVKRERHESVQTQIGASRALRDPAAIGLAPPPTIEIGLVGAAPSMADELAITSSYFVVAASHLEDRALDHVAALVIDGDTTSPQLRELKVLRERRHHIPVLMFGTAAAPSRVAARAGALFVVGAPGAEELAELERFARAHVTREPHLLARWLSRQVAPWIRAALGRCVTERGAEVIGAFAVGAEGREHAALLLGMSVKRLDEHIGVILEATGRQQRIADVAQPFARRIAELWGAGGARESDDRRQTGTRLAVR